MDDQAARDATFVLRVWLESDDDQPRARLLRTGDDTERTEMGNAAIVAMVADAVSAFVDHARLGLRSAPRDADATRPHRRS